MKKYLGIDQSYTGSGFCIINEACEVIEFGLIKSDKTQTSYERALSTALQICDLIAHYNPDEVNIEGLAFGMTGNATRDLAGLLYTIVNVTKLKHPSVAYVMHSPTTVKKRATGSGKAKKPEMIAALPEGLRSAILERGIKKTTGLADIADAYFIATMSLLNKQPKTETQPNIP
jgi:Holliday junction resolvasome RuvABC endonuclease subunit